MAAEFNTFDDWLDATAAGRYVRDWQQHHYDEAIEDVFGYYALQIGAQAIEALRASRIQHGWRLDPRSPTEAPRGQPTPDVPVQPWLPSLYAAPEALPFGPEQFDLIVMPHGLEASHQPHAALREATRVLRPEGRLIISGFNPSRLVLGVRPPRMRAPLGAPIGYLRLRDWLHLMNFEVQEVFFGCYVPGFHHPHWYQRLAWLDRLAHGRVPVLGGTYFVVAVKKVQGVRMLEATWKRWRPRAAPATTAAHSRGGKLG